MENRPGTRRTAFLLSIPCFPTRVRCLFRMSRYETAAMAHGSRDGGGMYAQLDHALRNDLKLIGGFQANKIGKIDLDVVPRAGVVWNTTAHVNVKALYSKAFRAPSLNETRLNHPGLEG